MSSLSLKSCLVKKQARLGTAVLQLAIGMIQRDDIFIQLPQTSFQHQALLFFWQFLMLLLPDFLVLCPSRQ